ncbi:hypothetical protein LC2W_2154 [Lacticaseibacillus paracasei]|nr:hypothetical protein LCAZH_1973 [Lacticaseibacillus paracasei]AEA54486.1 hypothetical protein LC2W_2154 [Lacticaseibacillus paracasei]AEA57670.1 hypothetical protein LCBD_2174 [Lacticaseibacillus paracasei]
MLRLGTNIFKIPIDYNKKRQTVSALQWNLFAFLMIMSDVPNYYV